MDKWTLNQLKTALRRLVVIACIVALQILLIGTDSLLAGQTLGSCNVCREYNRACLQAHSKQACKSEMDMCLKHCKQK
jgi:hypothetical protein